MLLAYQASLNGLVLCLARHVDHTLSCHPSFAGIAHTDDLLLEALSSQQLFLAPAAGAAAPVIASQPTPPSWQLFIDLPSPVHTEGMRAKLDAARRTLTVTAPLLPQSV